MTQITYADVTVEDAYGIAHVHVSAWQAAYATVMPAEYLASLSVDKREASWRKAIASGTSELVVAREEGHVVGWAAFGPSRDEESSAETGEIRAIYVAPSHWSQGIGRLLWFHARDRLIRQGYTRVHLWVLAENTRAIKFYLTVGFTPEPGMIKEIVIGGKHLQEVRYVTSPQDR